jgi:hypothetical protein
MFVVIFGLFVVFFAIAVTIVVAAGTSTAQRKRELDRREREEAQIKKAEQDLAYLSIPGEPLICLGCQKRFLGPMPPDGCPDCQMASLVVSERSRTNNGNE